MRCTELARQCERYVQGMCVCVEQNLSISSTLRVTFDEEKLLTKIYWVTAATRLQAKCRLTQVHTGVHYIKEALKGM